MFCNRQVCMEGSTLHTFFFFVKKNDIFCLKYTIEIEVLLIDFTSMRWVVIEPCEN